MDQPHNVTELVRLVEAHRFDLSDEKRMQAQLAEVLGAHRMEFEREKRLSDRDIPDFLVAPGIAVECKLSGRGHGKMAIFKQVERYAQHEQVLALVLITNVAMGLPPTINGKPVYLARLARGWM